MLLLDMESSAYRSLPVRGAWIEIPCRLPSDSGLPCRSPCGERGLKSANPHSGFHAEAGRSPCGERGLKFITSNERIKRNASLPVRGAWIEIERNHIHRLYLIASLPVRGAWIEIRENIANLLTSTVAPRAGSVD